MTVTVTIDYYTNSIRSDSRLSGSIGQTRRLQRFLSALQARIIQEVWFSVNRFRR